MVKISQVSLLALVVMMASLVQPAWSMDEEQDNVGAPSPIPAQYPLISIERIYTTPFCAPARLSHPSYQPALNVFQTNIGCTPRSLEELDKFKQDPHRGDLIQRENFQRILKESLDDAIPHYMGYYPQSSAPKDEVEKDLLIYIEAINFKRLSPIDRMTSMEAIVKSGSVKAVESLTQVLLKELPSYSEIMKEAGAPNDVPIFWLPAIVTRWDEEKVPDKNYREIEEYLCKILCPEGKAEVQGKVVTRDEFVNGTNEWKVNKNRELGSNRYQLPLSFVQNLTK